MPARPAKSRRKPAKANPAAFFSAAEAQAAQAAGDRAQVRTPREVSDAFAPKTFTVAGETLRALTLASLMILEQIESPLADENFGPDTEVTARDMMAVLFVLTREPEDCSRLLSDGRPAFDAAVLRFAAQIPLGELGPLTLRLRQIFIEAFATLVAGEKKRAEAPSTPRPTTASAGG